MKKHLIAIALIVPAAITLSGCSINIGGSKGKGSEYSHQHETDKLQREKISRLNEGEGIDSVRNNLGIPDFTESYTRHDKKIKVLFYRTQRVKADGITSKDECTPLIFVDNKLDSWGNNALAEI
ncbi:DUF3192 domain-containing protein [Endozoicomonas arenosclerae]|uniref:DUF3192 domain-containing protein n=1 Tax=Endozoicomonas arenosclerae TaxID=1633495 RepID=UPI0007851914|nr:DUF3192 domain-containing protein [Endozoicomonas arenosclerae]